MASTKNQASAAVYLIVLSVFDVLDSKVKRATHFGPTHQNSHLRSKDEPLYGL